MTFRGSCARRSSVSCGPVGRLVTGIGIIVLAMAAPLAAQQDVVAGTVVNARDGVGIADVTVLVPGLGRTTTTDGRGRFRIAGVPAGTHTVATQAIGFAPDTLSVTLAPGGTGGQLDFRLTPAAVVVQPLVVSATREVERRSDGSMTVDAVSGADIRRARAAHPAEILNRVAGVHVSQTSGEGHMMAMRLPITTNPLYLYLEDGVPTRATGFFNHNALYEVNLPQAAGIEVIKGPGTALYGSDAIGGIVNVLTKPAPLRPSIDLSFEGGAYGYRRVLATGGTTWGDQGVRADLNVTHSDNWKERAPFDRQSATLRWDALLGRSGWMSKTVLAGSRIDQQDVPTISQGLFDTAATTNLAPIAYRRVRALRLSNVLERESGASLWSLTTYGRINDMGLLPSWQLSYDPQTYDTKNRSLGMLARYRRDIAPWQGRIILGVDGELSPGSYVARRAVTSPTAPWTSYTDGPTLYDYDVTYRSLAPYLQTAWMPAPRLRVDAGLRADFAGYAYDTHLAPVDTGAHRIPASTTVSYSHLSPKVGATYEVSPAMHLFASYRHGFRAPSQGQLFVQNSATNTVGLEPVKVNSYEAGVRGQVTSRVVYQLSAYSMTLSDDILTYTTPANTREATNAGETRHEGLEVSVGAVVLPTLRVDAAYAVGRHRYLDWVPAAATATKPAVSYSGHDVEQAPGDLASVVVGWTPRLLRGGAVALEWSHTGRYAEDPGNIHFYPGYQVANLRGNVFLTPRTELFARVINLTDRHYAELVSYDAFRKDQYTSGMPRSFFAGARYVW